MVTEIQTVYVGSLWHEFCDPFVGVIALDPAVAEAKLAELADAEIEYWIHNDDETTEDDISVMTSGVFPEPYANIADFIEDQSRLDEYLEDLRTQGYAIV